MSICHQHRLVAAAAMHESSSTMETLPSSCRPLSTSSAGCQNGYRLDEASNTCQPCSVVNCEKCDDDTAACSSCQPGYGLMSDGKECRRCASAEAGCTSWCVAVVPLLDALIMLLARSLCRQPAAWPHTQTAPCTQRRQPRHLPVLRGRRWGSGAVPRPHQPGHLRALPGPALLHVRQRNALRRELLH